MVRAAGPPLVYVRVKQKTNRKKGVLPPAWAPAFNVTRLGTPIVRSFPRAEAPRPCLLPGPQTYAWSRNRTARPVTPSPGHTEHPRMPGTEGPCALELRAKALGKRIQDLEKAKKGYKRQEALTSLKRYKREYNRCLDLLEGCAVADAELVDEAKPGTPYTIQGRTYTPTVLQGCRTYSPLDSPGSPGSPGSQGSTVSVWSTSPRKLSSRGSFPFTVTEDRRLVVDTAPRKFDARLFAY